MKRFKIFCLLLSVGLVAGVASAQATGKNELGFVVGGEFLASSSLTPASAGGGDRKIASTSSLSLELNYGREVHRLGRGSLWLDVPALVGPNHKLRNGNPLLPTSDATFYVTPSLRYAFPSRAALTPWVSGGFGYGLFETSDRFLGGAANPVIHTHTGVAQFGAGLDVRTPIRVWFPVGLRGEFRDFYALSQPTFFVPTSGGGQNSATVSGGVFLRF